MDILNILPGRNLHMMMYLRLLHILQKIKICKIIMIVCITDIALLPNYLLTTLWLNAASHFVWLKIIIFCRLWKGNIIPFQEILSLLLQSHFTKGHAKLLKKLKLVSRSNSGHTQWQEDERSFGHDGTHYCYWWWP